MGCMEFMECVVGIMVSWMGNIGLNVAQWI